MANWQNFKLKRESSFKKIIDRFFKSFISLCHQIFYMCHPFHTRLNRCKHIKQEYLVKQLLKKLNNMKLPVSFKKKPILKQKLN